MPVGKDTPNFERTEAALMAYDSFKTQVYDHVLPKELELAHDELADLEMQVADAFWQDTKDRNSRTTCLQCIRPGPMEPPPGSELSYVRRTVQKWREGECQTIQN